MLIISFSIYYYVKYGRLPIGEIRTIAIRSFKMIVLLLPLIFLTSFANAVKWDLKKDSEGIKIYTADVPNSEVKALKAELITVGTPTQLVAILMDIKRQKEWVYSTVSSSLIKSISSMDLIYYTEKDMPWPVTNRDAVIHLKIVQDATTKITTISATSIDNIVATKRDLIRVPISTVTWTITPITSNSIKIVYEARLDPGGTIPAWVVNMFTTKGPFETFKKLKAMLDS
jgi:hypothetical protein